MNNSEQFDNKSTVEEQLQSASIIKKAGLVIVGIALIIIAITAFLNSQATVTMGTVVSVATNKPSNNRNSTASSVTYMPIFTFVDNNGVTHKAPYYTYESGLNFKSGKQMKIGYDPDDFSSVRIVSWSENLTVPFYISLLGAFLIWLSIIQKKQALKELS